VATARRTALASSWRRSVGSAVAPSPRRVGVPMRRYVPAAPSNVGHTGSRRPPRDVRESDASRAGPTHPGVRHALLRQLARPQGPGTADARSCAVDGGSRDKPVIALGFAGSLAGRLP
jgi:hypothetical protein